MPFLVLIVISHTLSVFFKMIWIIYDIDRDDIENNFVSFYHRTFNTQDIIAITL